MPEHERRHPDFELGNAVAMQSGAWSPRVIEGVAAQIHERALDLVPHLVDADEDAFYRYERTESRSRLLHNHIDRKVAEKGIEAVKPWLWAEARQHDLAADRLAAACGLTPASRAALIKDLGIAKSTGGGELVARLASAARKRTDAARMPIPAPLDAGGGQ